jgi:alanyl-tRNA synthetase
LIKIAKTERIQDGVERLIFAAGVPAIRLIQEREGILHKTAEVLGTPIEKVEEATRAAVSGWKESRKQIDQLKQELAKYEAKQIITHAKAIGEIKLVKQLMKNVEPDRMIKLAAELIKADSKLVVVFCSANETARVVVMAGADGVKAGIHSGELANALAKMLGGGGSGKPNFGQGGGEQVNKVDKALKAVESLVEAMLRHSKH